MKNMVNEYTSKLKLPTETSPDIVVKGNVVLEGSTAPNFSLVTITVVDKKTEETIGTYAVNSKTGTFILILRPDQQYQIIVENEDYQIHTADLSYPGNTNVKEVSMEIRLKK